MSSAAQNGAEPKSGSGVGGLPTDDGGSPGEPNGGGGQHQGGGGPASGAGSGQSEWDRQDVCRDYLKNVCSRGSRCKFYHPPDVERPQNRDEINFCIDFQNRGCRRETCRYVHATREDAERYKRTGEVTLQLACAIAAVTHKDNINGIPFCKEYKMGKCMRGQRCRYWHVDPDAEKERRLRGAPPGAGGPMVGPPAGMGAPPHAVPPGARVPQPQVDPWNRHDQMRPGGGGDAYAPPRPAYGGAGTGYDQGAPMGMGAGAAAAGRYDDRKRPRYDEPPMVHPPAPMPTAVPPTMGADRSSRDAAYIAELERSNAELRKENDSLARELTRERERYEDLYALFRQHQHQASAALQSAAHTAQSALVQQQQQQQQPGAGPPQQGGPPPQQGGPGALGPPPVGVPVSLAPVSAMSSMTSMATNPQDVAVHWSTVQMR